MQLTKEIRFFEKKKKKPHIKIYKILNRMFELNKFKT